MAVRKSGLGKGLDSLIPDHHLEEISETENQGVVSVKISRVERRREQPGLQGVEECGWEV